MKAYVRSRRSLTLAGFFALGAVLTGAPACDGDSRLSDPVDAAMTDARNRPDRDSGRDGSGGGGDSGGADARFDSADNGDSGGTDAGADAATDGPQDGTITDGSLTAN